MVRFGKVVEDDPPIVQVPLKVTVPDPETVLPLFVQLPATSKVLFMVNVDPLAKVMLLQTAAELITG